MLRQSSLISLFFLTLAGAARPGPSTRPVANSSGSPVVTTDGRVTFRFHAPKARSVGVGGSLFGSMHREGADWILTVGPVVPNIYYYHFVLDGATFPDPTNSWNHEGAESLVLVPSPPGETPRAWEITGVPHGSVQTDYYTSRALPGQLRRCHVYLPPGYDPRSDRSYPTLYLLHGNGGNDASWTSTGRANFMLDNLIAAGQAVPMVVVMPDGGSIDTMKTAAFVDDVLHDLIPSIEKRYRVKPDAADRAVAGLSMGGAYAMHLAFDHPGEFGAVGIWSAAWLDYQNTNFATLLPRLVDSPKAFDSLKVIDLSCGRRDGFLPITESLDAWLSRAGLPCTEEVTPSGHTWTVWRVALLRFAPRLFRRA